jgi:hypothetical protein
MKAAGQTIAPGSLGVSASFAFAGDMLGLNLLAGVGVDADTAQAADFYSSSERDESAARLVNPTWQHRNHPIFGSSSIVMGRNKVTTRFGDRTLRGGIELFAAPPSDTPGSTSAPPSAPPEGGSGDEGDGGGGPRSKRGKADVLIDARALRREDERVGELLDLVDRLTVQGGNRLCRGNSAEKTEYFQRSFVDPVDEMIEEAAADPHYRTIRMLEAVLKTPWSYHRFNGSYGIKHLNWEIGLDAHPFGETMQELDASLIPHLAGLLGAEDDGLIEALDSEEIVSLFRAIRDAYEMELPGQIHEWLASSQNALDLRRISAFFDGSRRMPSEHRMRFKRLGFVKALSFSNVHTILEDYWAGCTRDALRYRIGVLPKGEDASLLVRTGLPHVERSMEGVGEGIVPIAIIKAVDALEGIAVDGPIFGGADDRFWAISADMRQLDGKYDYFRFGVMGRDEPAHAIEEHIKSGVAEILEEPEPIRSIAVERTLAEDGHKLWPIRLAIALLLQKREPDGEDETAVAERYAKLVEMTNDRSRRVAVSAMIGALDIIERLPDAEFASPYPTERIFSMAQAFLAKPKGFAVVEICGLLNQSWRHLDAEERSRALDLVVGTLDHFEGKPAKAIDVLDFVSKHEADLSAGQRERLSDIGWLAPALADSMASPLNWLRRLANGILPFYLRIANNSTVEGLKGRAWSTFDSKVRKGEVTIMALSILGKMFTMNGELDANERSRFLEMNIESLAGRSEYEQSMARNIFSQIMRSARADERLMALEILRRLFEKSIERLSAGYKDLKYSNYLAAFVEMSAQIPEWQTPAALGFFDVLIEGFSLYASRADKEFLTMLRKAARIMGEKGFPEQFSFDIERLKALSGGLPPRHMPILFEMIGRAVFGPEKEEIEALVKHLIDKTERQGQFQQLVLFFRDFMATSAEVRRGFVEAIREDSRRTYEGQIRKLGENDDKALKLVTLVDEDPFLVTPQKARSRLNNFLIERFANRIGRTRRERASIRADLQRRARLWGNERLLPHLASLTSFSNKAGIDSVRRLVRALSSEDVSAATARANNRRFVFSSRFESMEGSFSPEFIGRWANGGRDRVIPLGRLEASQLPDADPETLMRAKYDYAARQMANHLNVPGVSHLDGPALYDALARRVLAALPQMADQEEREWAARFEGMMTRMGRSEQVSEVEIAAIADFLQSSDQLKKWLGDGANEAINDLVEFKRSLSAEALEGQAWLVITSDPAEFIGSGRSPVTCQDPTRNTGYNTDGQPINRTLEGRFLYAKVIMGRRVELRDGIAIASPDAIDVGRVHLEATTKSGMPDPEARPHLLAERAYVHPGFIYKRQLGRAINSFAQNELGLDPKRDVHMQFTGQNMSQPIRPLEDRNPIYRDTFHR